MTDSPWARHRPDIALDAHWIWTSSFTTTDEVWCRCTSGGHDYDDGLYGNGASDGQVHIGCETVESHLQQSCMGGAPR